MFEAQGSFSKLNQEMEKHKSAWMSLSPRGSCSTGAVHTQGVCALTSALQPGAPFYFRTSYKITERSLAGAVPKALL